MVEAEGLLINNINNNNNNNKNIMIINKVNTNSLFTQGDWMSKIGLLFFSSTSEI